jgi:hypothetical protein
MFNQSITKQTENILDNEIDFIGYDSLWMVRNYWKEPAASLFRAVLKIQSITV